MKKIPQVKKRRQQMPMPTDIHDYLFSSESAALWEKAQESFVIGQSNNLRHLSGKYERYYLEEERKLIVKDLVNINGDGRIIVRSMMGIQKGFGIYFMNSTLAINLFSLNDNETFCSQLLSYVGRFNYSDVECLFAICTAIDTHNTPVARMEVLIPSDTFGLLPEHIKLDSQAFFKLNFKYPNLLKALQSRQIHASNKVVWQ
ncbi:hypothetical protein [Runella sp.]|uniref:hypothetical protein n=1 Tax=Runella sp. TaxID=1960881 RepID=UPI00261F5F54|nr:hypothetical protein [Runella sp.]